MLGGVHRLDVGHERVGVHLGTVHPRGFDLHLLGELAHVGCVGISRQLHKVRQFAHCQRTEVVIAAKDADRPKIVAEMADLWFHCLVALQAYELHPQDVLAELARREGLSGLEEFALRKARLREAESTPAKEGPAA